MKPKYIAELKKVVTGKVRISYPALFKPNVIQGQDESKAKYGAVLMIPKEDTETVAFARQALKDAAAAQWGANVPKFLKNSLSDGDTENQKPEYKGHYILKANSKSKPMALVAEGGIMKEAKEGDIYGGCYVLASINAFVRSVQPNMGVYFALDKVIKIEDGAPFGKAQTKAEDDFESIIEGKSGDNIFEL